MPATLTSDAPRVARLRSAFIRHRPEICVQRAVLITESYRETENEPAVLRRAYALHRILERMSIYIEDDDLIVGNIASRPRSAPIYPEFSAKWILDQMDTFWTRSGDKLFISEEDKATLREVLPYWEDKTVADRIMHKLPAEVRQALELGAFSSYNMITGGIGHFIPGYERVLQKGFGGIREDIQDRLSKVDVSSPDGLEKSWFYHAALIACDAVVTFAQRYAALASQMAQETDDIARRAELQEISRVCQWVPEHPPRSFHEALQSFWFTHLLPYFEANGLAISPGRFDQYMFPYYNRDVASGVLTSDEAMELLECLWVKFPNIIKLYHNEAALSFGGFPTNSCISLGGQTEEGEDATNQLSYHCLQATADTRLPDPSIAVRFHRFSPDPFVQKACEVIRLGTGMPKVFNDEVIIPALLNRRYSLEDARNFGIVGCVEPSVGGKTFGWCNAAYFNLAKCLELALNDGVCPSTGIAFGVRTGSPDSFTSIGEVINAYERQVSYFVDLLATCINSTDISHRELAPLPLSSCLYDACIQSGKDLNQGGAEYNFSSPQGVGVANVADSLAAVKHIVFDEKSLSLREFLSVLHDNFDGHKPLLNKLLYKTPKFGNDEPEVDHFARLAGTIYSRSVESHSNPRGGIFQPGLYPVTANIPMGAVVGALPDGRLSGAALADGVSPVAGRDVNGPTAVMKSVARLEHIRASNGTLLNLKFSPTVVSGSTGLGKMVKLVRGYIALGGWHVQFNIIEAETLRLAQQHPDEYRDLVVRVAGYSAFFVELDQAVQNDIILRTTHQF